MLDIKETIETAAIAVGEVLEYDLGDSITPHTSPAMDQTVMFPNKVMEWTIMANLKGETMASIAEKEAEG